MDFPTTHWTQIVAASLHGDGRSALDELCRAYYAPVRQFIAWRRGPEDSADLTQAFFLYVIEQGIVRRADRLKGKFRTFLLAVLKRFLSHHDRAQAAEKRGGAVEIMPLDELETEPAADAEEITRFDREWAVTVMSAAAGRVGEEIVRTRDAEALEVLKQFLGTGREPATYETAASLLGMSLPAVKSEIMRWRRRLGEIVRAEVGRTVSTPQEVEEGIAHLRRALLAE